jgi:DNA mismatch repair protein MutS
MFPILPTSCIICETPMSDVSPVRRQYLQIKRQYPQAIVFFRLGDFYETFDEDAEIAARELDLVLTSRPVSRDQRVPMAGIPHHAADGYIVRLIAKGYHVAICEQMSAEPTQGLMPRKVTRVVTPGTVIEPQLLNEKRNNYLAAVVADGDRAGLAYVDITTGEFATTQLDGDGWAHALQRELARLQPAEAIVPDEQDIATQGDSGQLVGTQGVSLTRIPKWRFELGNAQRALLDYFGVSSLAAYGCEGLALATQAAGAILQYLAQTQALAPGQLTGLRTYSTASFMALDVATRRNLELTETIRGQSGRASLLGVLDMTRTPMGGRLLRQWIHQPLTQRAPLEERLDCVGALVTNTPLRAELGTLLKGLGDLERITNRVVAGSAGPRELLGLARALETVERLKESAKSESPLSPLFARCDPCSELSALIGQAIADDAPATLNGTGVIRPGYSSELDGIIAASRDARKWVADLERVERERTGIKSLKVGYNKVFGYYIEVTQANLSMAPTNYIRKQTLTGAERFITPELKEYEALILNADERIQEIETRLFRELCARIAAEAGRLRATAQALAEIDVLTALAEAAVAHDYVRPELTDEDVLEIRAGRHPVVEVMLQDERFVANDARFSEEERILIITGPNMSGKSVYLRQVALIVLMAQIGSFVPAAAARVGLVDRIFTRIGAQDEIAAAQSTFMVEMVETANILHHATNRSLIVFDEVGRGTSTYDGVSIAWAIVEYLHNHPRLRAKTLFATHYHELTEMAEILPAVHNYNVAVTEEGDHVVFLHQIVPGGADRSYGIHVAQLAGLPRPLINRATEVLAHLERHAPQATKRPSHLGLAQQLALFPETSPLIEELKELDVSSLTPLEAMTKLYEWQRRYAK